MRKWHEIFDLKPKPENVLDPASRREIKEYLEYHQGIPTYQYECQRAQLRLMSHLIEELKMELLAREASFIDVKELEEIARDYETWRFYDNVHEDPRPLEDESDGTPEEHEERHRWDHVTGVFVTTGKSICEFYGDHDLVDCSEAGPDSGNMDHRCRRCGQYWSIPLY